MGNKNNFEHAENCPSRSENVVYQRIVNRDYLTNKLNYINFEDGTIFFNFKHIRYNHTISLKAKPQPCLGRELSCVWPETEKMKLDGLANYEFNELFIADRKNMIIVVPQDVQFNDNGVNMVLPEQSWEVESRKMRRFSCDGISAKIIQNSVAFEGRLVDFSAVSFHIKLTGAATGFFSWIETGSTLMLTLSNERLMLYAGECRVKSSLSDIKAGELILKPLNQQVRRYKPKDYRTSRYHFTPSSHISFCHPFIQKEFLIELIDLSGAGFAVEEEFESAVLIPGMIIPSLYINFSDSFRLPCMAQIIYRKIDDDEKGRQMAKCGAAILHMDINDHGKLLSLLFKANDAKEFLCGHIHMDDLWQFFFESGFIYPEKYAFIESNKESIKKTYERLYTESPAIAKHFIYRDRGRILGHMAMIRLYEKSWMIHHHAANSKESGKAGLDVLDQIGRFINGSNNIASIKMDYVFCYYRPENKFPKRVFGGIAERIGEQKACSVDGFLYTHHNKSSHKGEKLSAPWHVGRTNENDIQELALFYRNVTDGLMLDALEITTADIGVDALRQTYHEMGFKREKILFSLKFSGQLKAVALVNISDTGLNLSDLTNSMSIFIIDEAGLTADLVESFIDEVSGHYEDNNIPVLLFPTSFAEKSGFVYEKIYNLWVLDVKQSDKYFHQLFRLFNRANSLLSKKERK